MRQPTPRSTRTGSATGGGKRAPEPPDQTGSLWPHVEEAIVDRILQHRSTIVFSNSRRLAERLTGRLNEIYAERLGLDLPDPAIPAAMMAQAGISAGADPVLAKAHHGSVSKEQRAQVEEELKSGTLRCVVATSSLELGIDMGAVDLVIQVEAPPSAASGLQRIGRAGHQVGEVSRAALFPKHRGDVLHTAIVTERMLAGQIEAISVPQNPLDILAQQTVAACALGPIDVEGWFETVKRSAPFRTLPRSAYEATLDLLAGRFPSDEFAELRPRLVWDRDTGTLTGRPGAQRIAVTSGGTIPDRGLFGVFVAGESQNARVGELDEEMVYESRSTTSSRSAPPAGASSRSPTTASTSLPAYGQPGKLPFWHGDGLGRPAELGEALGKFSREVSAATPEKARDRLREAGLDDNASVNLLAYLAEQREATGTLPTDRSLTVERGRDEVGDWRVILHSPYGMKVHGPWALAVNARIRERLGVEGSAVASDDGIIARVPDATAEPPGAELFVFEPDELEQIVTDEVGGSALFASRFRECAARALLMPRMNPNRRSPLWQQRQRSAQLLEVARRYPTFPIILETLREVLQDVYDVPALLRIARSIGDRSIRLVETTTTSPSPFARDLLFGYVGAFMYEGDSPLAERRAAALSVDPALLSELLGKVEMRELLDPEIMAQFEREAQRLDPERRARGLEGVADLLRMLGPLDAAEVAARLEPPRIPRRSPIPRAIRATSILRTLDRRGMPPPCVPRPLPKPPRTSPNSSTPAARSRSRSRASRGSRPSKTPVACAMRSASALPVGIPNAFLEPLADPLGDLVARYARTHGPFASDRGRRAARRRHRGRAPHAAAARGAGPPLERLLPAHLDEHARDETEWCDAEVLRRLRMRSLAAIRGSVEPVSPEAFARFLPVWQHVTRPLDGIDGVAAVIEQLAGVPIPASAWESLVLPGARRTTTPRRCSTSSPRPARSSGRVTARCPAATGGSRCTRPMRPLSPCCHPKTRSPRARSRSASSRRSRTAARTSPRSCASSRGPRTSSLRRRGAVEPHLGGAGHERHVRPGADAARRRLAGASHRAQGAARPDVPRSRGRTRVQHPAAAARDRRTLVAARRPPNQSRPCARPRPRVCCSIGTASSRAGPCRPRACRAGSPRRTACSPASSRPGTAVAAT